MTRNRSQAAVAGTSEIVVPRRTERHLLDMTVEVARAAIMESGLKPADIDVVIPCTTLGDRYFNTNLGFGMMPEELGLVNCRFSAQVMSGGSTSGAIVKMAASMIETGAARNVLVVQAENWGSRPVQDMIGFLATAGISEEWEIPYGHSMNAVPALMAQRYMYETGATAEHMAAVSVCLRDWARLNPLALYRGPLTIEDVLNSKIISSPVHQLECNMLADGATAFVLTRADDARHMVRTPAYVRGFGSRFTHHKLSAMKDITDLGFAGAAQDAYEMAGITPADVDLAELYDAYPVFCLLTLEQLGLCGRGEAGPMVLEGACSPGGRLPLCTNGGMLSQGHTGIGGGLSLFLEGVRQLRGQCGERQVADATTALATSSGGTYMDAHVTILSTEA